MICGPHRPADVLGVADRALYLRTDTDVLALVTADAVRLPCAAVLPSTADLLPLRYLVPDDGVRVGHNRLTWRAHGAPVDVEVVREWAPARVCRIRPRRDRIAELRTALADIDAGVPVPTTRVRATDVARLLGRGPGLTPSGDDLLAGYLLGCRAFAAFRGDVGAVAAVVAASAEGATTALSAALLRHALAGRCVPEVADVVHGLAAPNPVTPALDRLLRVGHTSGAALAHGLSLAAAVPARPRTAA